MYLYTACGHCIVVEQLCAAGLGSQCRLLSDDNEWGCAMGAAGIC